VNLMVMVDLYMLMIVKIK